MSDEFCVYDFLFKHIPVTRMELYKNLVKITGLDQHELRDIIGWPEFPQVSCMLEDGGWTVSMPLTPEQYTWFVSQFPEEPTYA